MYDFEILLAEPAIQEIENLLNLPTVQLMIRYIG